MSWYFPNAGAAAAGRRTILDEESDTAPIVRTYVGIVKLARRDARAQATTARGARDPLAASPTAPAVVRETAAEARPGARAAPPPGGPQLSPIAMPIA